MRARGGDGRGTVGQMQVLPNSRNVIPGEVEFSVEFRHPDAAESMPGAATTMYGTSHFPGLAVTLVRCHH